MYASWTRLKSPGQVNTNKTTIHSLVCLTLCVHWLCSLKCLYTSLSSGRTIARFERSACSKATGRPLEDRQEPLPKVTLTPVSSPAPLSVTIFVPLSSSLSATTTENNGEQRGGSNHIHSSVGCVPADCPEDWSDQDRPQSCSFIDPLCWLKFIF